MLCEEILSLCSSYGMSAGPNPVRDRRCLTVFDNYEVCNQGRLRWNKRVLEPLGNELYFVTEPDQSLDTVNNYKIE